MTSLRCVFALVVQLLLTGAAVAGPVTIAAASDLRYALDEILEQWQTDRPEVPVQVIYGSSGRFATQIRQGAPFDIYMSADIAYTEELHRDGLTAGPPTPYAIGRIVLWSLKPENVERGLSGLAATPQRRIAIARPEHAPYGARAREALERLGIWNAVERRLVYGENIAHAAQMARSGAADSAVIALSLVNNDAVQPQGHWQLIDASLHSPLLQAMVITSRAAQNADAHELKTFLGSPQARAILEAYGFEQPDVDAASPPVP